jgi:Na+-translocating ferredoxin:NAD+ oxidoreductase RnfC subunit
MNLADQVKAAGVVGAGGGGFPTHIKLSSKAEIIIANGAECEPLLHKDAVIMENEAAAVVRGMLLAMDAVGAREAVIGIKEKKHEAIEAIRKACAGTPVRVHLLGDYYPAGDEYDLVYSVTGQLIPPGGIPLQTGVIVNNVETFVNIAAAADGKPVTHKMLTIAGAVASPGTFRVPVGITYRECLPAVGGLTTEDPVLCVGGLMMGQTVENLDMPVTKTSTGVVILPRSHPVVRRKLHPAEAQARIGKSACDQCRYCTEYCPRFLLGYTVEPHQVMRSLAFTATGAEYWNHWGALCCACGLCTLYSCPEGLFPKEACDQAKSEMRKQGLKWSGATPVKPHPMHEGRRVPIQSLTRRLNVQSFDVPAPYRTYAFNPRQYLLPLKQGAGAPLVPLVQLGDSVTAGQRLACPAEKALGANLHAPAKGRVAELSNDRLVITPF